MDSRTKYKVDKYVSKLKNAQNPEEADMYQAKLRFYHRKNLAGGSGADVISSEHKQKEKEASITDLLSALKDRIQRCDTALEKLKSMDDRMSKIEEQLNITPKTGDKTGDSQNNIFKTILNYIKGLKEDIDKLKENNSSQRGGSTDIVLDMSSDVGEEFNNAMFSLFN